MPAEKLKVKQTSLVGFCFVLLLPVAASADTLTGKVVKITDGDTLYVLDANYKEHKIRLAGIDAPERKQAYGLASRKHLASIVADPSSRDCVGMRAREKPLTYYLNVKLSTIEAPSFRSSEREAS